MIAIDPNGRGVRRIRTVLLPILAAVASTGAGAATITVDSIKDPGSSDSSCTLREAVTAANNNADADGCVADTSYGTNDTINFAADIAGAENLTERTVQLTQGALAITQSLTINGTERNSGENETATKVVVDANGADGTPTSNTRRVLKVRANTTLKNIVLTGGRATAGNGGIILLGGNGGGPELTTESVTLTDGLATGSSNGKGGAIYIQSGSLKMTGGQVSGSRAQRGGGGIYDAADNNGVTLTGVTISGNKAGSFQRNTEGELKRDDNGNLMPDTSADPADGGGLYLAGGGEITATQADQPDVSRIIANVASGSGGGIWTAGKTTISNSKVGNIRRLIGRVVRVGNNALGDASGAGGGNIYLFEATLKLTQKTKVVDGEAAGSDGAGGGILANGGSMQTDNESVQVNGSVLLANYATNAGGGLALRNGATATIERTAFNRNGIKQLGDDKDPLVTRKGGALHADGAGTVTLSSGSLGSNAAALAGGAIYNQGSDVTVTGYEVRQNVTQGISTGNGGNGNSGGGAFYNAGNSGTLTINDSRLISNAAGGDNGSGGAILNTSGKTAQANGNYAVKITGSQLTRNSAAKDGGAIETTQGEIDIEKSTLGGNTSADGNMAGTSSEQPGKGGAVHAAGGTVTVKASTISYNTASQGGGLWNAGSGDLTVNNSTISNNQATGNGESAGDGGGFYQKSGGAATLNYVTVTKNSANNAGGGVAVGGNNSAGEISDSIIAGNSASTGANVVEGSVPDSQGDNFVDGDAGLDGLQFSGGPTLTHPLLADSAAVDSNDSSDCSSELGGLDQRGATRPASAANSDSSSSGCDFGSYELGDNPRISVSTNGPDAVGATRGEDTVVLAFSLENNADSDVTLDGFSAEPLYNGGYGALLNLLPAGSDASEFEFEVFKDPNDNGKLDEGEDTSGNKIRSADSQQAGEFSLTGGLLLAGNDTTNLLVILRVPKDDSNQGNSSNSVADLLPQTPLYAGGMLLGLIAVCSLTGVRRRTRVVLALAVIAIGLTACSNADDPASLPSRNVAPELQGDIRFRLTQLTVDADSSSNIIVGDGLPVYGPAITVR